MKRQRKFLAVFLIALISLFSLSACSPAKEEPQTPKATDPAKAPSETVKNDTETTQESSNFKPFTIKTFEDHEVTFDHVPKRVVSLNLHTTENLLALGLEDKLVGTAYGNADILPKYKEAYDKIEQISEKYPSLEVLLSANPDFVYGRSSAFGEKGVASVSTCIENNIMPYVSKATYTTGATMEDTYTDFETLGKIFNVEDRAQAIIDKMKSQVDEVSKKTATSDFHPMVFVYDSGTDDAFTCGGSLQSDLIRLAGGTNVFSDVEKTWTKVSWEKVVEKNPDIIVINDYGKISAEEKIKMLKDNPALSKIKAIENDHFVVLPLPDVFTGIRNGDAVTYLAKSFFPELFE